MTANIPARLAVGGVALLVVAVALNFFLDLPTSLVPGLGYSTVALAILGAGQAIVWALARPENTRARR